MANLEIVTSSILQDELEHVGTGVRPWKMEGGEGEIDSGSDYVLTPPLAKEPEETIPVVIEKGLRNPESAAGEQERAAGAAPLVEEEHLCVQEHNVLAYQGVETAKTPNDKESCVDAAKDCISAVAVAPPSKNAGPRTTRVREKCVHSGPVESDSRNLGNGDAPSDSGFSVSRPARKSSAIHLAEIVLIIFAQTICSGRPCPNATPDSRLRIHHPIQEGKAERRESKKTTVQTKAVVAEHVLGSSNPVEPKVARTELRREKRRASKAESQRLKKDSARPRWVGGSWGTALAAERKLAIYDAFYRQKRGVETRNTARKRPEVLSSRRNRPGWTSCRAHTPSLDILNLAQVCQSPNTCIRPLTDAPSHAPLEHVSRVGVSAEPHSHKSQSKSNPGRIHRCPGREIFIFFLGLLLSVAMLPTAQTIIRVGSVTLQPSGVLQMTASWTDSPKNGTR
jgi:hypothetical protein